MKTGFNRRQFSSASLAVLATATCGTAPESAVPDSTSALLPTVRWGRYDITRLLLGHNPIKGQSHFSAALSRKMREHFADREHGLALLRRCQQAGINTCQMGGPEIEALLEQHHAAGGRLQWIATLYSQPGAGREELKRILSLNPRPIGAQVFGNMSDALMKRGQLDRVVEHLKVVRDSGLLVGLGSHNHEVIDYAENKGWDVDFYQCCFYHSVFGFDGRRGEVFEEEDRRAMVRTIRQVAKPCIGFKVLGANRHCATPDAVERALRFAYANIKPTDVVLVGMWQKHKDQVAENVGYVRRILADLTRERTARPGSL